MLWISGYAIQVTPHQSWVGITQSATQKTWIYGVNDIRTLPFISKDPSDSSIICTIPEFKRSGSQSMARIRLCYVRPYMQQCIMNSFPNTASCKICLHKVLWCPVWDLGSIRMYCIVKSVQQMLHRTPEWLAWINAWKTCLVTATMDNWWNIISIKIFSADVWKKRRQIITKMFLIATKTLYNIWKTLNPIINPKAGSKSTSINKLLVDGKVIKDKSSISDAINNHFCTIGEVLKSDLPDWGDRYKEYLPARVMNSFFIEPICNDDVGLEIRHLNPKKAPGPDCIGGKLIQLCPDIFSNNLTKIYNRAIQTGVYPHDMKLAQVIAPYKKGARHDPNNYCPISLFSIFDKIFEKILCKRLISFLERNRILYCHQYGFRKFYSTLLALIEVTDLIKRFLDEKQCHRYFHWFQESVWYG